MKILEKFFEAERPKMLLTSGNAYASMARDMFHVEQNLFSDTSAVLNTALEEADLIIIMRFGPATASPKSSETCNSPSCFSNSISLR